MKKDSRIFIAGHKGLVGSAIYRLLEREGFKNLIVRSRRDLDLTNQASVNAFFREQKLDYVFLAAAKVGGIMANQSYPAQFIYENLIIACNVINASYKTGVKKILNLASSCIYPAKAPQPMKEQYLLTSELEKTNEAYAIAKIASVKLCRYYNFQYGTNFISLMPTNIYGAFDNFNMETAHALPMVLRRLHLAKMLKDNKWDGICKDLQRYKLGFGLDEKMSFDDKGSLEKALNNVGAYREKVVLWGDGSPYREWIYSDDLADACFYLMENKDYAQIGEFVNITSGKDSTLKSLFEMMKGIVGFEGALEYDQTKPNGMYRKLMDSSHIKALGWQPKRDLEQGIRDVYEWYKGSIDD